MSLNIKTEIEWISTDDQLPPAGAAILVLLPHMGMDPSHDWLEIRQVWVPKHFDAFGDEPAALLDYEERVDLDWDVDTAMWWAPLPDWMKRPGWRRS